jgi:hypothetical protein
MCYFILLPDVFTRLYLAPSGVCEPVAMFIVSLREFLRERDQP